MKSHCFFTTCTNTRSILKFPANITATFTKTLILKHSSISGLNLHEFFRMHDLRIYQRTLGEAEKTLSITRKFLPHVLLHPLHSSPLSCKCSLPRWFTALAITLRTTTKHSQHSSFSLAIFFCYMGIYTSFTPTRTPSYLSFHELNVLWTECDYLIVPSWIRCENVRHLRDFHNFLSRRS